MKQTYSYKLRTTSSLNLINIDFILILTLIVWYAYQGIHHHGEQDCNPLDTPFPGMFKSFYHVY